jgi:hypothetical protein
MPRYRHVIEVAGYDLPGHLARTRCGRVIAYGRQPNVPRSNPRFCPRCRALDDGDGPYAEKRGVLSDGDAETLQRLIREQLRLLSELRSRYGWQSSTGERCTVGAPRDVYELLAPEMEPLMQEQLRVLLLDTRHHVIDVLTLYQGTVNQTSARIAELFRDAVRINAPAIVLAHNHPSGDATPSGDDIRLTQDAAKAGELLGIELLDHIVVGRGCFVSLKERRLL